MRKKKRVEFGEYIVSDLEICGGRFTFKGTRILVKAEAIQRAGTVG